jgi:hypothetical protein
MTLPAPAHPSHRQHRHRRALPIALAVGLLIVAAVAVVLATRSGGSSELEQQADVTLAPSASQGDLLAGDDLRVRISGAPAGAYDVTAAIDGGAPLGSRRAVRIDGPAAAAVAVPVTAAARRTLASCTAREITVTVSHGGQSARGTAPLRLQPPACGRFFSAGAFWNRPVPAHAALDPKSPALVRSLVDEVNDNLSRHFGPWVNHNQYSVPIYTVTAQQKRVPVGVSMKGSWTGVLRQVFARGVPVPHDARAAAGGDGHLVVWQPATDTMWEFWQLRREGGRWVASWGGRIDHASRNDGVVPDVAGIRVGATASSLPLAGGLITLADLQRGRIDHAVAFAIARTRSGWWTPPARRTDGAVQNPNALPEGVRLRLDPKLDLDSLQLSPFVRMLAEAVQKYGMVLRDTSPNVTFFAQDPRGGADPYPQLFGTQYPDQQLRAFPWNRLQALKMDLETYPK